MYYYVYKVTLPETGEYYIGSRKSKKLPEIDPYMGSMCAWKPDKSKLIKEILFKDFLTHQDALKKETEVILECWDDHMNKNHALPNGILYTNSPKQWLIKKYGKEKAKELLDAMYDNNASVWRKGNTPWNKGKPETPEHIANIKKTWHSTKRLQVMSSEEYRNKMSDSMSGEKNPMFGKTIYEIWNIKYGKDIADKKLEEWHKNKKGKIPGNKNKSKGITITSELIKQVKILHNNKMKNKEIAQIFNITIGAVQRILKEYYK
jgi:hypothetical protein